QTFALELTGNTLRDEPDQSAALGRSVAQLLGERGRDDQVGAEPVVEVFAEAAFLHLARQVAVGGGDELARKFAVAGIAETLKRARLKHTEELDLHRRVELADLVEEDGAQRRAHLQPTGTDPDGAPEPSPAMAPPPPPHQLPRHPPPIPNLLP